MIYNKRGSPRQSMTLVETLVVIVLLALIIILLITRIGGYSDRPKDLEVQKDFKIYSDAATALMPTNSTFSESNLNKFVSESLELSLNQSKYKNPYGDNYKFISEDSDNFKIISKKIKNGLEIHEDVLTVNRLNGKLSIVIDRVINSTEPPATEPLGSIEDFYRFEDTAVVDGWDFIEGYKVVINSDFWDALNENKPYKGWKPGDPIPNPGTEYKGTPIISTMYAFAGVGAKVIDLSQWDTSNIITMSPMFEDCRA